MLACGCDEYPEVSRSSWQTARKQHHCCECGHVIEPGETYWRLFQVYSGEAMSHCRCERCADLADAFRDLGYCDYIEGLFEAYQEWLDMEGQLGEEEMASDRVWTIRQKHRNWNAAI